MTARRVLVVEPMTSALEVLDAAASLGWRTAAATWDSGDRRMPEDARADVNTLIQVDPNDEQALFERGRAEHRVEPFDAFAGVHNFTAPHLRAITAITGNEELASLEWVREVAMNAHPGDATAAFGDFRCRLGHALFVADTLEQAEARRLEVAAAVHIV